MQTFGKEFDFTLDAPPILGAPRVRPEDMDIVEKPEKYLEGRVSNWLWLAVIVLDPISDFSSTSTALQAKYEYEKPKYFKGFDSLVGCGRLFVRASMAEVASSAWYPHVRGLKPVFQLQRTGGMCRLRVIVGDSPFRIRPASLRP
jgi:hypothetical protein